MQNRSWDKIRELTICSATQAHPNKGRSACGAKSVTSCCIGSKRQGEAKTDHNDHRLPETKPPGRHGIMTEHEIRSGALLLPHPSPMHLPLPCRSRSLSQAANS